jgi:hypothetical protein
MGLTVAVFLNCAPPQTPPHFLWSVDAESLENPFPDERLMVDGQLALRPKWYQPFLVEKASTPRVNGYLRKLGLQAAQDVSAFGAFGPTLVPVSESIDSQSAQGAVVRLTRNQDGRLEVLERKVHVETLRDVLAARSLEVPSGAPEFLFVRPAVPLPEGREGVLAFLRGPKTRQGVMFGADSAWAENQRDRLEVASALGVSVEEVLLTLPQRAGVYSTSLRALSNWASTHAPVVTIPPHGLVSDGNGARPVGIWNSTDPDWNVVSGYLTSRRFGVSGHVGQIIIGELATRDVRENGVLKSEWVADPSLAPLVSLRFVLALPRGPRPPGGWPIVISQHGVSYRNTPQVGNNQSFVLEWAEPIAAQGLGCLGIDAPDHGSRGTFTDFFSVDDLPRLRDRFREMTFDLLQVEAAIPTIDVESDGVPDFAPQVRFFGNSLGAIMGSGFVAVSNRVSTAVFNVPGAGLTNVIMSASLQDLIGLLLVGQTGLSFDSVEYLATFPIFRAIGQPIFDAGDSINLAGSVSPSMALLQQVALGDRTIPNDSSFDLAGVLGLQSRGSRVLSVVDPAKYLTPAQVKNYNAHFVMYDFAEVRKEAMDFLRTDGKSLDAP